VRIDRSFLGTFPFLVLVTVATVLLLFVGSELRAQASPSKVSSPATSSSTTPQPWKIAFDRNMNAPRRAFDGITPANIFAVNVGIGLREVELTNDDLSTHPVWCPDGKKIAFVREGKSGGIFVMDADGTNVHRITEGLTWVGALVWSPDSRKLAFDINTVRHFGVQPEGLTRPVYVADINGDQPPQLLTDSGASPSWAPDSTRIAYTCVRSSDAGMKFASVCLISTSANSTPHVLISHARTPLWSPDGKKILYISTANREPELFVAQADGSDPHRISDARHDVIVAAWSPDGKHVAYTSTRAMDGGFSTVAQFEGSDFGPFQGDSQGIDPAITQTAQRHSVSLSNRLPELFVANADGSGVVHIGQKQNVWCNQFSWSPDSVSIAGLCGSRFYNKSGGAPFLSADSILLLSVAKPNSKPGIIARTGIESVNSLAAASR
jgi:dipeptidyl aminopeptidase/acylaminoacyl peptidase